MSDKSRVNSSSYRNEALASHGGSQVLNVAPQTERNPGHSGAMADASKAADAVDATGSLSVGALAVPDSDINRPPTGGDLTFSWKKGHI